jgi:hypothetical protein
MRILLLILCIAAAIRLCAQEFTRKEIDVNQIADELYGLPDADVNYDELYENLLQLITSPLNLNKATTEDLRFIKLLSESQISQLLDHRRETGNFISVYELQAVPEFDLATVHKLAPFVTVQDQLNTIDASLLKRIKKEGDSYLLMRYERTLQTKSGFEHTGPEISQFKGSPDKLCLRFRSSTPGDFSMGFTAEKDPGEQVLWSPSTRYYGADYFSYHVQLQNKGKLKNLIIGDFQTQFGQGLMLGGVLGMGKGGETITTIRRSNIGLLPYTSAYEGGAMRGVGFSLKATEHLQVTGFFSKVTKDGTLTSNDEEEKISSFQTIGLHRNENELAKRKIIGEINLGTIIQYDQGGLNAGLMFNQTVFNAAVHPTASAYNQFNFGGKVNRNIGLYFNYTIQNVSFFGEIARSLAGGFGGSAGMLAGLSTKLDLSLLYRSYGRNFYTFYSSGFAENTNTQNEKGIYWGWKYTFNRRYRVAGYVDIFKFPWLRFRSYAPSTGYEWLLRLDYEPSRKVKIFIQAREELKSRNVESNSSKQYKLDRGDKKNYWINLDYSPHAMLRLRSRAQLSTYTINKKVTQGFALIQDLILDAGKLKLTMRYAIFDTEDYDNRQYSYENDVWLAYSIPAYNGSGVRKMAMIEYKVNKTISVWLRYARMRYQNLEFIGNGVDRIDGDCKDDVKAQVVVKF